MSSPHTFRAKIEDAGGGGAFVSVPFDVEKAFGKKRVKILATFDGVPYRGSMVRMGSECHLLPVLKEIREQIGKTFGDEIEVTVEEDTQPRQVTVPDDLRSALEAERCLALRISSYTTRKSTCVGRRGQRRARRAYHAHPKTVEMLRAGQGAALSTFAKRSARHHRL
jgi:hypothetical protein